jgi:hypothetical protein
MNQYTNEARRILDDFTRALEAHPNANQEFVKQIKALVEQGKITHRQAIQEAITTTLKEAALDES